MKITIIFALSCVGLILGANIPFKNLAGPPSEFAEHVLPEPINGAQVQRSTFEAVWITSKSNNLELPQEVLYQQNLFVDSAVEFQFAFSSPYAAEVGLTLLDPNGNIVDLSNAISGQFPIGDSDLHVPESSWIFQGLQVGTYTLVIKSNDVKLSRSDVTDDEQPFGFIFTLNDSPITMIGHLSTYNSQQGENIGVVAMIVDNQNAASRDEILKLKPIKETVLVATLEVIKPDGVEEDLTMHDDGLHMDGAANDGIYGAYLNAEEIGNYKAQAILTGVDSNGVGFRRTTQHLIASSPRGLELTGSATGNLIDSEHIAIYMDAQAEGDMFDTPSNFITYAQVYGYDSNGNEIPVCWIGGMANFAAQVALETSTLQIILDTKWLNLAGASLPLVLKNIVIQDSQSFIPISTFALINVQINTADAAAIASNKRVVSEITLEMREGVKPASMMFNKTTDDEGSVILIHGYCASLNPWKAHENDWEDGYYFLRASQSMTHDDFAQRVVQYASDNGLSAYSLVGHSQGGAVAAHIMNYYWSGLDNVENGRKLQSLGSPYEGCSLAGNAAGLGNIFGIGCGTNFDLSLDGAKLWTRTLSSTTRSNIYYYTTTYKQGNLFGDYCNLAANMILQWPNDGVAELDFTDLPGANNMGNTQKQCHSTDMNYMVQYDDKSRNKEMSAAAAR